jgi:hypothetical protein
MPSGAEVRKDLKDRMEKLKPHLPQNWILTFAKQHPEYDTIYWGDRLRNIASLRSMDKDVVEKLEGMFKPKNDEESAQ